MRAAVLLVLIFLPLVASSRARGHLDATGPVSVQVDHVVDGDTLWVRTGSGRVDIRILGIDCPESHHNAKCRRGGDAACDLEVPKGQAATVRARSLLTGTVTLEPSKNAFQQDRYGRTLAYVRLPDGRDYGLLMIQERRCADYGWKYPHPRGSQYQSAQAGQR